MIKPMTAGWLLVAAGYLTAAFLALRESWLGYEFALTILLWPMFLLSMAGALNECARKEDSNGKANE